MKKLNKEAFGALKGGMVDYYFEQSLIAIHNYLNDGTADELIGCEHYLRQAYELISMSELSEVAGFSMSLLRFVRCKNRLKRPLSGVEGEVVSLSLETLKCCLNYIDRESFELFVLISPLKCRVGELLMEELEFERENSLVSESFITSSTDESDCAESNKKITI